MPGKIVLHPRRKSYLRQMDAAFKDISDAVPVLIWMSNEKGECFYFNKRWHDFTGRTFEQEEGTGWEAGLHPQDREDYLRSVRAVLENKREFQFEFRLKRFDGEYRWMLEHGVPRYSEEGAFQGYIGSCIDISDRKALESNIDKQSHERELAEAAVRQSEHRYRTIVEDQIEFLLRFRLDGLVTFSNGAFFRFFKRAREGLVGPNRRPLVPAPLLQFVQSKIPDSDGLNLSFEHSIVLKSGETRWLQWTCKTLIDDQNRVSEVQAVGRDITTLRSSEEKLRTFHLAIESSIDGIAICDSSECFIFMNQAHARMFGAEGADFYIGKHWSVLYGVEELKKWQGRMEEFLALGRWRGEVVATRANGTNFSQEVSLTVLPLGGIVCVCRDISARKESEEILTRTAAELARSNADLEQFAYVASHDLQEPLRMVSTFVELLEENSGPSLSIDSKKYIGFVQDGVARMRMLIRDLLSYSRVGRDTSDEDVSCNDILLAVKQNLSQLIESNGAVIHWGNLPRLRGNFTKYLQLFQNFIENAIKYRSQRPPIIRIQVEVGPTEYLFSIVDNGMGFDSVHRDRIFQIFQRLHPRHIGSGSGIGLAIAKKIVEGYGGRIWAESVAGRGATFYFTIPKQSAENLGEDK